MQWMKSEVNSESVKATAARLGIPTLTAAILHRRMSAHSAEQMNYFINASVHAQHDPFLLRDMLPALERIAEGCARREKVLIFGDRDVDGVTSTALLYRGLSAEGLACRWQVPCGEGEYGLSPSVIEACVRDSISLIITVDCGISNYDEIVAAQEHGIDTIVIDHHNPPAVLPPARAIINPKQEGCHYPHTSVSACMLVYKCMLALHYYQAGWHEMGGITPAQAKESAAPGGESALLAEGSTAQTEESAVQAEEAATSGGEFAPPHSHAPISPAHHRYLAERNPRYAEAFNEGAVLAALSTIADMMPLVDENRLIVDYGLQCMAATKNKGIHTLLRKRDLTSLPITARSLAFNFIPLLNAAGRLGNADVAVELLLADEIMHVEEHANRVIAIHGQQKKMVEKYWDSYRRQAKESLQSLRGQALIIADANIPSGITGLLANKLLREFHAPAVVISLGEEKINGSMRNDGGEGAAKILSGFSDLLIAWGGHDRAAGFTVKQEAYPDFMSGLRDYYGSRARLSAEHNDLDSEGQISIDAEIPKPLLTYELFETERLLEPFGQAFPPIVYCTKALTITNIQLLGQQERHAKLLLNTGNLKMPAVFWNCSKHLGDALRVDNVIDVVYNLDYNYFRHVMERRLSIIDVAPHAK